MTLTTAYGSRLTAYMRSAGLAGLLAAGACSNPPAAPPPVPATSPAAAFPGGDLVDLSHAYEAAAIFWPTADPFRLEKVADGMTPAGYYYASNNFFTSEHGGTHMDAPVHFAQGKHAADQVPLDRLVGPALVIDVAEASNRSADYQVTVEDLQRWEQQHGAIRIRCDCPDQNRLLAPLARRGEVPGHGRAR